MKKEDIAKQILHVGRVLYEKGYVIAHDGNISCRYDDLVYITPTNVSKGFMDADEIAVLTCAGEVISGKPSSEYKLHLALYNANPKIKAVVHTHPVAATTFAVMGQPLDPAGLAEAEFQLGYVPIADYYPPSSDELAGSVVPFAHGYSACLLANHGLVSWGTDLAEALFRAEIAEFLAQIRINIKILNK